MKLMFLDESGDHNLDPKKVQSTYPVFVLAGCIFDESYYHSKFVPKFNSFKKKYFGTDNVILHMLELTRPHRSKDKRYLKIREPNFRIQFYTALNRFIQDTSFSIVACVIKKENQVTKYGLEALDPYLLSFENLLNKFVEQINKRGRGLIIAEKRNDNLDNQLTLAWLNAKISGTEKLRPSIIKEKVKDLSLIAKSRNQPGLQLADLVASPIGRHVINTTPKPGHEIDIEILQNKMNTELTILPK